MKWRDGWSFRAGMLAAALYAGMVASSPAIEIEIDYSLDTAGFFNQAGSKEALRAVCDFFETVLTDDLARIDPSEWTGEIWTAIVTNPSTGQDANFPGKVVPADTVILYAGGRNDIGMVLGVGGPAGYTAGGSGGDAQAWFNLLKSRGEAGALLIPARDFASWGGSIAFNRTVSWNFSLTETVDGKIGFVSVALHELSHVFGVGVSGSWDAYVASGQFTGPASVAEFGGNVPLDPNGGHWRNDGVCVEGTGFQPDNPLNILSKTVAQFGVPAGLDQIALLDPSGCYLGPFHLVMTDLDLAALSDVGWEIASLPTAPIVPPDLLVAWDQATGDVNLRWLANPALTYRVEEASGLTGWQYLGAPISGQSGLFDFIDTDPPLGRNFYRLEIAPAVPVPASQPAPKASVGKDTGVRKVEVRPKLVHGCAGCRHAAAPSE